MLRHDERGSALPLFGGLLFVSLLVTALVVEVAMLGMTYRATASAADASAEAGAAMLSVTDAYASSVVLDPSRAQSEARLVAQALAGSGAAVTVEVSAAEICVTVTDAYEPTTLAVLGVGSVAVASTTCAEPRTG